MFQGSSRMAIFRVILNYLTVVFESIKSVLKLCKKFFIISLSNFLRYYIKERYYGYNLNVSGITKISFRMSTVFQLIKHVVNLCKE